MGDIACSCGGVYWRRVPIDRLRDDGPENGSMVDIANRVQDVAAVRAGKAVECSLRVTYSATLYVCVECGFPERILPAWIATKGSK